MSEKQWDQSSFLVERRPAARLGRALLVAVLGSVIIAVAAFQVTPVASVGEVLPVSGTAQLYAGNISVLESARQLLSVISESTFERQPKIVSPTLAQVTVRPDAPKRVFEEKEDKPWTLLVGKAMLPATVALGAFVVIWYVMKVTRARYKRAS
ncbi:MAG: hypothetical protein C4318_04800 [Acidimicrobiia bacterium]